MAVAAVDSTGVVRYLNFELTERSPPKIGHSVSCCDSAHPGCFDCPVQTVEEDYVDPGMGAAVAVAADQKNVNVLETMRVVRQRIDFLAAD